MSDDIKQDKEQENKVLGQELKNDSGQVNTTVSLDKSPNSSDTLGEESTFLSSQEPVSTDSTSQKGNEPSEKVAPHFTDEEIEKYTGRPRISKVENESLKNGARFFRKAMESSARARGESYEPFRLPANMRVALAQIDIEAAKEKAQARVEEAKQRGENLDYEQVLEEEKGAISALHALDPEEQLKLQKEQRENQEIEAGGARFYGRYKEMIATQEAKRHDSNLRMQRNLKFGTIVLLVVAFVLGYKHFFYSSSASTISELKASLPLVIDDTTTLVRIDDRNNAFKMYWEKDPKFFENVSEEQKQAWLDTFESNASYICKDKLLKSLIDEGQEVSLFLDATDGSFHRQLVVKQCSLP